jgi:hypothetical protein
LITTSLPTRTAVLTHCTVVLMVGVSFHFLMTAAVLTMTDWRNFTVVAHTESSITFSIVDPDGKEGFPGEVISYVTYTMSKNTWNIKIVALATTKKTPIMLTSHTYWNLDGFQNPDTPLALNHTLHMPYSGQRVGVDNILIPDGTILPNEKYSVNDFWSAPKQIGANLTSPELLGNCGYNCTGYDNCYAVNRDQNGPFDWRNSGPVASLSSAWSGIKLDIYTDQEAFQMYSCGGQNGMFTCKVLKGSDADIGQALFPSSLLRVLIPVAVLLKSMAASSWKSRTTLMLLTSRSGSARRGRSSVLMTLPTPLRLTMSSPLRVRRISI